MNLGKKVRSNCTLKKLSRFPSSNNTRHVINARSNYRIRLDVGQQSLNSRHKIKVPTQSSDFRQELRCSEEKKSFSTDRAVSVVSLSKSRNISNHALIENINLEEVLGNSYRKTARNNTSFISKLRLKTERKLTAKPEPNLQPINLSLKKIAFKNNENDNKKLKIQSRKISLRALFRQADRNSRNLSAK